MIFFKASTIESVLSVHAEIVFKFTGCLFKEQKINIMFLLDSLKHLLILNMLPKAESKFLSQLFFSVIGRFCLCFSAIGRFSPMFISNSRLTEQFQDHRRLIACILRVEIAAVVKAELIFRICK
jgi:hypothetical protein